MKRWVRARSSPRATIPRKSCAMRSAALRVTSTRLLSKIGFLGVGQEEVEGADAFRKVAQGDAFDGIEELGVEVVNPELVEVAEDDDRVAGAGRCAVQYSKAWS